MYEFHNVIVDTTDWFGPACEQVGTKKAPTRWPVPQMDELMKEYADAGWELTRFEPLPATGIAGGFGETSYALALFSFRRELR
jgi:hypothetical protein